jgi:predicted metal-dependent phosphoesterase TrpH
MLIDLHTHTHPISWDSYLSADELVEWAKAAGLDGICLSEHDFFWKPDDLRDLAKRHDFLVLPAVEINTEDGHVLAFGLEKYVYGMHRTRELVRYVEEAKGTMVAAHPYRRQMPWHLESEEDYEEALTRACGNAVYANCAALEVINGRSREKENEFSRRLCERMEMLGTAGSDCHARADIGKCATQFERDIGSVGELIEELKAGRFSAVNLSSVPAK